MLTKHHNKILCLLANGFNFDELLKNGTDYIKENYLILKLAGIDKPVKGGIKYYVNNVSVNQALRWSAESGNLEVVKYLTTALGADIDNNVPLYCSIEHGHYNVALYILTKKIAKEVSAK